jgi:uncharacterized membrane protein YraQ (UPF0718 family)
MRNGMALVVSFGLRITVIYVVSGILLGMIGGFVLGKMNLEPYLSDWVKKIQQDSMAETEQWERDKTTFMQRLPGIIHDSWGIVKGVLLYVLIGIGIGAAMHGFVPEGFFEHYMSNTNWFAVPASVICKLKSHFSDNPNSFLPGSYDKLVIADINRL